MPRSLFNLQLSVALIALLSSAAVFAEKETGLAAVYNSRLNGHTTGCMEKYDHNKLTTAHKSLPCGTKIRVKNTENGKSVTLTVNDRGPTQAGRVLDISGRAAKVLGIHPQVMRPVEIKVLSKGKG